jgi:hypothetical protein
MNSPNQNCPSQFLDFWGRAEVVSYLPKLGANPNATLHTWGLSCDFEVGKLLVENGADINAKFRGRRLNAHVDRCYVRQD